MNSARTHLALFLEEPSGCERSGQIHYRDLAAPAGFEPAVVGLEVWRLERVELDVVPVGVTTADARPHYGGAFSRPLAYRRQLGQDATVRPALRWI